MKKLLLLLAIAGAGYYYYTTEYAPANRTVATYQELLKKVESTEVTREEVIFGANDLARYLCSQVPTTSSGECVSRYSDYREMCESRIFADAPVTYSRKDEVTTVAKAFVGCVGIR